MKTILLSIAGFGVRICVGNEFPAFALPASFAPFTVSDDGGFDVLFTLHIEVGEAPSLDALTPVATGINDLGEARLFEISTGYAVALSLFPGAGFRVMTMDDTFTVARLILAPGDPYAAYAADSMLRIMFSQAIVGRRAFLLHASAIEASGRAVLFMGRSGTGKSTHSGLWQEAFPDATLINDDDPVVRVMPDGTVRVYGSPWSGKTPCYRQHSAPVSAFVRLCQAPADVFTPLADVEAFIAILPGVSVISCNRRLYDTVCSTVIEAASATTVATLDCLPHTDAARLCRRNTLGD